MSQVFSQLTGRQVSFILEPNAALGKLPSVFAIYTRVPENKPIVARADRAAIAVLAGALLGMSDDLVIEAALKQPITEAVRDAMHEVLNIAAAPLSTEGRVVFQKFVTEAAEIPADAKSVVTSAKNKDTYRLSINGTARGIFALFS